MRRTLPALAVSLALLLPAAALADDTYLGTIVSSGASTTNLTTATPFKLQAKTKASIQCDAAVYVAEGSVDAGTAITVTSSNGLKLAADALFDIALGMAGVATNYQIAIIPVSGSANCKVFQSI